MSRKTLLGITIVWAVLIGALAAGLYVMATHSGTKLAKTSDVASTAGPKYTWNGDQLLVGTEPADQTAICRITPKSGVPKDITTYRSETASGINAIEPWFAGSAEMTCNKDVTVRSGGDVTLYDLATKNRFVQVAVVVIALLPFLLVAVLGFTAGRGKTSDKQQVAAA